MMDSASGFRDIEKRNLVGARGGVSEKVKCTGPGVQGGDWDEKKLLGDNSTES